ncbi:MAG: hypothetical protein JSU85_06860 [Candidatus Zixiibacteriota bacterium]|nr:MAG: hypothetical protein JSU85_06860 [candidate division Zixibacteria bacterium]
MLSHFEITEGEGKHKDFIFNKFKDLLELFERSYNLFLTSIYEAKQKIDEGLNDSYHRIYIVMGMKINSDARILFHSILNGWYATAESLFRDINDCIIKIIYTTYSPNEAEKIIQNKITTEKIRKSLKKKKIPMPLSEEGWGKISQMKHGDGKFIFAYGDLSKEDYMLRFYPTVFAYLIENLFIYSIALLVNTCEYFDRFFSNKYDRKYSNDQFATELDILRTKIKEIMNDQLKT